MSAPGSAAIRLPELAVPGHALVVPLPCDRPRADLVREWLALDPGLLDHDDVLDDLVAAAADQPQAGEVATVLLYGDVGGELVGGPAVLVLELIDPLRGSPAARVDLMVQRLRRAARARGHVEGLSLVERRRTDAGVPAARLQFVGAVIDGQDGLMVEAVRWLYPVPRHPDLVWSLYFQTTDLDHAPELVPQFDRMAGSLAWAPQ